MLRSATDNRMHVLGTFTVDVQIASELAAAVRFLVIEGLTELLRGSVVLGKAFIAAHMATTDWIRGNCTLRSSPTVPIPFLSSLSPLLSSVSTALSPSEPSRSVRLARGVFVAPRSSVRVAAVVVSQPAVASFACPPERPSVSLFEPSVVPFLLGLTVPSACVSPLRGLPRMQRPAVWVQLDNTTSAPVRCPSGMELGELVEVRLTERSGELYTSVHPERQVLLVGGWEHRPDDMDIDGGSAELTVQDDLELGPDARISLTGAIPLSSEQRQRLLSVLRDNATVFAEHPSRTPTTTSTRHRIDTGAAPPVFVPQYRNSPGEQQEINRQVEEMLQNGVVRPSGSPYSSPVLLVKKADGTRRFCVDFRKLNANTKRDVYPLPRIDDMLDSLGDAVLFTTLDLQSGFWQIPIDPVDVEKTAFSTHRGHFEFLVMPFGLTNAPATFQRMMDVLLRDLRQFCLVYIDDIIIFSTSFALHLEHLSAVFERLRAVRLVLKCKKAKLLRDQVKFLGHVVSHNSIQPDPDKVSVVTGCLPPTSVKELQTFLGLVGYYRRFVPSLAAMAEPLYCLLKKGVVWTWRSDDEDAAFRQIKKALTSTPLLHLPDFSRDFVVQTDASATAMGAVLSQYFPASTAPVATAGGSQQSASSNQQLSERPVYYASKTLSAAQRHYHATERECLAVKWAITLFRPYLLGRHFTVYTDHTALRWLFAHKDPSSKLIRWILHLQEYAFDILSRPGKENANADALSRLPQGNAEPTLHVLIVTRSATGSLPATRRATADPDLVLDARAYDLDGALAISHSLLPAKPDASLGGEGAAAASYDTDGTDDNADMDSTEPQDSDSMQAHDGKENDAAARPVEHSITTSHAADTVSRLASEPPSPPLAVSPDFAAIRAAQRDDPELAMLYQRLLNPSSVKQAVERAQLFLFKVKDELIYRSRPDLTSPAPRLSMQEWRLVIPRSWRPRLLQEYHDGVIGGHLGQNKTYRRLADKYWWDGMYTDVEAYVQSCVPCAARKRRYDHRQIPLYSLPVPSQPFEALGIDVLSDLPVTGSGHRHILVVTDYFTRWPFAFAMKNQLAVTIAKIVVEQVFLQYGFPVTLLSDQGPNFMSNLVAAVLKLFLVKKLKTTAYHPQTNGLTERFNSTLCAMLSHYVNDQQTNWDTFLPYVLYAYRTAPQSTTGLSPFFTLYGRNPRYPFDTLVPDPVDTHNVTDATQARLLMRLIDGIQAAQAAASGRLQSVTEKREKDNAELQNVRTYQLGEQVMVYRPQVKKGTTRKLTALWLGPYEIVEVYNNRVNYGVTALTKNGKKRSHGKIVLVHASLIKKYLSPTASSLRSQQQSSAGSFPPPSTATLSSAVTSPSS
jgi:transposase InsO family protein